LETETTQTCELVLKRKDGTFFDAQLESIAVQVDGQPAVNVIVTDITAQTQPEVHSAPSKKIVIIGAGNFACQLLDIVDACNRLYPQYEILGYIVDSAYGAPGTVINGFPILGDHDWFGRHQDAEVFAISSVAAPAVRSRLAAQSKECGSRFCNIVHPAAILSRHASFGEDVVIGADSILIFQNRIGNHVHMDVHCSIGEYAIIEDFVTLSPAVRVSGNVTIGKGAFIGTGVNIIENVRIGEWCVIGAGSTIIRDVPPNTTVVGVPGKVIKTREAGWQTKA
jgi:sugar O-acyltransferase (sialic acid O-acetyltransferase NeuD family)